MAPKFTPRAGCKERCCFPPAITPDGADTPKWAERMAAEKEAEEEASIGRQPVFPPRAPTPDKTVFTHTAESGNTPAGSRDYYNERVNTKHYGLP